MGNWPRGHGDPWRICVTFVHRYPKDCPLWDREELILTCVGPFAPDPLSLRRRTSKNRLPDFVNSDNPHRRAESQG